MWLEARLICVGVGAAVRDSRRVLTRHSCSRDGVGCGDDRNEGKVTKTRTEATGTTVRARSFRNSRLL